MGKNSPSPRNEKETQSQNSRIKFAVGINEPNMHLIGGWWYQNQVEPNCDTTVMDDIGRGWFRVKTLYIPHVFSSI